MSNKLQVVDAGKLDQLLNYIQEDRKKRKLVESITDPTLNELVESEKNLHNTQNINLREAAVVEFNKKRQKYKKEHTKEEAPIPAQPAQPAESSSTKSKKSIEKFIKDNSVVLTGVNSVDLIHDLSHQSRTRYMLAETDRDYTLRRLKIRKMPASFINNVALRKKFIEIDRSKPSKPLALVSSPESDDDGDYLSLRQKRRKKV